MLYLSMIRRGLPSFSSLVDPVVWHYIHSLAEDHAGRYKLKESMHSKSIQQHFRTYRTIHIRLVHTNLLFLLHGRNHLNVLAQLGGEDSPAVADVADQVEGFILC